MGTLHAGGRGALYCRTKTESLVFASCQQDPQHYPGVLCRPPVPLPLPAGLMVFFVSAVFHEVLVGVPLHMLRLWSFWGLMAQVRGAGKLWVGSRVVGWVWAPGRWLQTRLLVAFSWACSGRACTACWEALQKFLLAFQPPHPSTPPRPTHHPAAGAAHDCHGVAQGALPQRPSGQHHLLGVLLLRGAAPGHDPVLPRPQAGLHPPLCRAALRRVQAAVGSRRWVGGWRRAMGCSAHLPGCLRWIRPC